MTTISNVSPATVYPLQNVTTAPASKTSVANTSTVTSLFSSLSSNSSSPLTYNAAGLLNSVSQAQAAGNTTPAQAAQNAVLAAQDAVTQTLGSLMSGSNATSNTSSTDIFGASPAAGDPFASAAQAGSGKTAQAAKSAYLAAQDAVTQALNSIA